MIDAIYPYFIVSGIVILVATFYILWRSQKQRALGLELRRTNSACNFDLLDFIQESWPTLTAGGFNGLDAHIVWFGTPIRISLGNTGANETQLACKAPEIDLAITLYSSWSKWEHQLIGELLSDIYFTLLHMNIWIKTGQVRSAFEQQARKSVFLQHDLRNLLQIIDLSLHGISNKNQISQGQLSNLLHFSLPAIEDRVKRIEQCIRNDNEGSFNCRTDVDTILQHGLQLLGLQPNLHGSAGMTSIPEANLKVILDSLLGAIVLASGVRNSMRNLDIRIIKPTEAGVIKLSIYTRIIMRDRLDRARLFEPFWNSKTGDQSIGLYNARRLAQLWGGGLKIECCVDSLVFHLELPAC